MRSNVSRRCSALFLFFNEKKHVKLNFIGVLKAPSREKTIPETLPREQFDLIIIIFPPRIFPAFGFIMITWGIGS